MKILVTGGAGYIGSHAVRALISAGHEVIVVDSLVKGHREFVPDSVKFYQVDIGDEESMKDMFENERRSGPGFPCSIETEIKHSPFDAVMHFAGFIEAGLSMQKPEIFFENNCQKGKVLLEVMRKFNVKNMIFSSTAAVYGDPVNIPIKEDDPLIPTNFYGETKLFFEKFLEVYEHAYDFKYIALRYFNAAGANENAEIGEWHEPETHLIPRVLQTALKKHDAVYVFGTDYNTDDGTCVRDYIHVSDLVDAHVLALDYLLKEHKSDVFNLGNGSGYSVREVIDKAKAVTGVDFKVIESQRRAGDPEVLVADSVKAEKVLGWEPKYPQLKKIIESAWKWHQKV